MRDDSTRSVLQAARAAARNVDAPLLLAVSGGLDSMALLHAMAATARARIAAVATLDHGTGRAATDAAAEVARVAAALRLPAVVGHASDGALATGAGREAAWRDERHRFLALTADRLGARVVMAHSEDDQVETVLLRVLRGSGARGLAGLYAPSAVVRPFIGLRRAALARFAGEAGFTWREDPSNESREFFRNRVRHDLLPALRAVNPSVDDELLSLARRSAAWRSSVEAYVDRAVRPERRAPATLIVASRELSGYDRSSLSVLWPALAGRVGLALDRRGTQRLATFTKREPRSGTVPLSGGWTMEARGGVYILERRTEPVLDPALLPEAGAVTWGSFRFVVSGAEDGLPARGADAGSWTATLPAAARVSVRVWGAGDRLAVAGGRPARRVKRYLSEAGMRGREREGWPVVVVGEAGAGGTQSDVVWIPGVRRADAATARSGGPVRHYVCERIAR